MIAKLKLYGLIVAAFIVAALGMRWQGARQAVAIEKSRQFEEYQQTRRRIDDAKADDLSADDARKWLRDRSERTERDGDL